MRGCRVSTAEERDLMNYAIQMASGVVIELLSFTEIGAGVQARLRFCLRNWNSCNVGITYVPSLMTIGTSVQAISWFFFRNLRGSNVGITGVRGL
jgi:hypothetical protein